MSTALDTDRLSRVVGFPHDGPDELELGPNQFDMSEHIRWFDGGG